MRAKVTVIVFLTLLGGLSALNLATPAKVFSENENRYLQQIPEFSVERLISAKFTAEFDQFVIDQFTFRDIWVGVKTLSELALQKQISNGVYFAKDNYLIEMLDSVDTEQYARNLGYVADFSTRVRDELGVEISTMLAPTPSFVLTDKLPPNAPEVDQRALLEQAGSTVPGFVDVSGALGSHSGEYIFYRTDHHWTSLGAFYAYAEWRAQTGHSAPSAADYDQTLLSDSFYGTTYSKANLYTTPPDAMTSWVPKNLGKITVDYNNGETITDTIYERSYLEIKDKYSAYLNANQPITRVTTENTNGQRLLIVKDSYANAFVQMALADFEEIVVIDLRYFKLSPYDFIRDNGITDLLVLYSLKGFSGDTNLFYLST